MTSRHRPKLSSPFGCGLVSAALLLPFCGCSGSPAPASSIADAEGSVVLGAEALKKGDYAAADQKFTHALDRGALLPDLAEQAKLGRARARIGLGNLTAAKADLEALAQRAAAMDQVWVVRGELCLKAGDKAGAKAAYAKARMLNPAVVIPAEAQ